MKSKAVQHLQSIQVNDEYGTRYDLLLQAMKDYKIYPRIDICSNNYNFKFAPYYTKEDNALTKEFTEPFFGNLPYSLNYEFMEHCYKQHKKHNVDALLLTFAKTDTEWWHKFVEGKAETHFVKRRISFNDEFGSEKLYKDPKSGRIREGQSPYPSVWIIFRKKGLKPLDPDALYQKLVTHYIEVEKYTIEHANRVTQAIVQREIDKRRSQL